MFSLNCRGRLLSVDKPAVMGILNVTPDSFFSGSRIKNYDQLLFGAEKMLNDGALLLDIGGQSTRPGSDDVGEEEELKRVVPAIELLQKNFPESFLSVDTFRAKVAKQAIEAGACMVNDISAGSMDRNILSVVAHFRVPYVLMHMQGSPKTMQHQPAYTDVVVEVLDFLSAKLAALNRIGICDVIVDPGIGFGKTREQNLEIVKKLSVFQLTGAPVMLGISRKSVIGQTLNRTPEELLNGTTVMHTIGLVNGANMLRAHDVKEAAEAIKLVDAVMH